MQHGELLCFRPGDIKQGVEGMEQVIGSIPDQAEAIQKQIAGEGLSHVTMTRVCKRLATRAVACQELLQLSSSSVKLPAE